MTERSQFILVWKDAVGDDRVERRRFASESEARALGDHGVAIGYRGYIIAEVVRVVE